MLKSDVWRERILTRPLPLLIPLFVLVPMGIVVLLYVSMYGIQHPTYAIFAFAAIVMALVIIIRQNEIAAVGIIAIHLYVDWYLGYEYLGLLMALGLLLALFLGHSPRSRQYFWIRPQSMWLWALFLGLTISPAIQGATTLNDLLYYYPNIIFGALLFFWLGLVVAQNKTRLRRLFQLLAALSSLLAIHTLIQETTGVTLLGTTHIDTYIIQQNGILLGGAVQRYGSFFMNPDWNGTFFGVTLFLPLGLFIVSTSFLTKLLYLVEAILLASALLSTYSVGGWIGASAGFLVFMCCVDRWQYRLFTCFTVAIVALVIAVSFPAQLQLQFQHATNPAVLSLRNGAWQTAIEIIKAHPLTGIGLGLTTYLHQSEPYRVLAQFVPLAHPHNAYLELGAMAGLPVLLVFLLNLFFVLRQVWRNWLQAERDVRTLIACGLACTVALSVNSMSINGWTLPPLTAMIWLILGASASPLIVKKPLIASVEEHPS